LFNFSFEAFIAVMFQVHTIRWHHNPEDCDLFNSAQFSSVMDKRKQLTLGKTTYYLHSDHCTPNSRTCINFPKNVISV